MTTTAHEDQFTVGTQTIEPVRQPYSTEAILRRNVADLEIALRKHTERAEKAEAELARLREQTAIAQVEVIHGFHKRTTNWLKALPDGTHLLFTGPVPAPTVPDGDDFNGTTPHLIQCMEALVRLDADGVLVPHGIGRDASKLLTAAANRLRQQAASSVPEEWLKCWLIERPAFSEWSAIWLTITTDGRHWVSDGGTMYATGGDWYFTSAAREALKFADKESADEYVRHNKIKDVVVTEHIFDNRALLQSAEVKK